VCAYYPSGQGKHNKRVELAFRTPVQGRNITRRARMITKVPWTYLMSLCKFSTSVKK
jgi:hypothetical protein